MLLCKKKQSFFLRPAEEILAYQKITQTNVLVIAKTTQKQIFIKIQLFQKNEHLKIFIADSDGFKDLRQDFIIPLQRVRFTNQLLHWLLLGDFCRYSYTVCRQGNFNILYCLAFNIFNFIDFALIMLFLKTLVFSAFNFKLRSFRMIKKIVRT